MNMTAYIVNGEIYSFVKLFPWVWVYLNQARLRHETAVAAILDITSQSSPLPNFDKTKSTNMVANRSLGNERIILTLVALSRSPSDSMNGRTTFRNQFGSLLYLDWEVPKFQLTETETKCGTELQQPIELSG